ncbi:MAG: hypothetical protein ABI569_08780 [Casimicrobiaceae bacterium]
MIVREDFSRFVMVLALPALVWSCAGAPSAGPSAAQVEPLLVTAGFKTVVARTDRQLQQLPTLPAGQVTVITHTGKEWFVYPDLARNRVYVGTEAEYRAYLKLRAQNNLPDKDPQASYYKQDTAMTATSKRYAGIPWDGWPEFAVLTWP